MENNNRKRTGVYIKCEWCGKEVYQTQTQYNRAKHHFCSNKCQHLKIVEENTEIRKCEFCGLDFKATKSDPKRFCCIKCQNEWQKTRVGSLNPRYTRKQVQCEICGKTFVTKAYKTKNGQKLFCSDKCRREWYSKEWSQTPEWKEESRKRAVRILNERQIDTNTKPQIIVNHLLNDMNIHYRNEENFKYYAIDNYLVDNHLAIEVMGDYWHCSPIVYKNGAINDMQKDRIARDKAKNTYLKRYHNLPILYLWESDIYNNINVCKLLIERYVNNKGKLDNYHSFNYHLTNNKLRLNTKKIIPYQNI